MSDPSPIPYLPADIDAARPEDLIRPPRPKPLPTPRAAVLDAETPLVSWPQVDPSAAPFIYIGQALTPAEFRAYCVQYDFGSVPPSFWIWHHTWNPDASWAPTSTNQSTWWDHNEQGMSVDQKKAKRKPQLDSIMRYYRDTRGWEVGPHLFTDDLFIWLFTPMYEVGIHANEGNSYHKNGKLRYSIGCEVIGNYDPQKWPPTIASVAGWACACVKSRLGFEMIYTPAGQDRPDVHDMQLSGHRDYTTDKSCPGHAVTSDFYVQVAQAGWAAYQANTPPGTPTDPLATHSLPGALRPMKCSKAVHDFYYAAGRGFALFGYATADEHEAVGANGAKCTITPTERAVIKSSTQYGVELALLSEAEAQGWAL